MAFSVIPPGFRQKRARFLSVGGQLQGVKTGFGLYPVQRVPRQWGSDRKHPLFLSEVGKSRRRRQGCGHEGNKMPSRPHPAVFPPQCSKRQPPHRTLPTAPDSAGQRAQAHAQPPLRLPLSRHSPSDQRHDYVGREFNENPLDGEFDAARHKTDQEYIRIFCFIGPDGGCATDEADRAGSFKIRPVMD